MTPKYIETDKLIAEIEALKKKYGSIVPKDEVQLCYKSGRLIGYEDALYKINKLQQEQPEVDLEKEIKSYFNGWEYDPYSYEITTVEGNAPTLATLREIASHFYELGLSARKEK